MHTGCAARRWKTTRQQFGRLHLRPLAIDWLRAVRIKLSRSGKCTSQATLKVIQGPLSPPHTPPPPPPPSPPLPPLPPSLPPLPHSPSLSPSSTGVPTPDGDPVWKCVCTLTGYHTRDVYDISWYIILNRLIVCSLIKTLPCV